MSHKFPALAQQLKDLNGINQLCTQALLFARLGHDLIYQLPGPLQTRCQFACVNGTTLVFLAENPTWAAKLRLHFKTLLTRAQKTHALKVDRCAVKIARVKIDSPQSLLASSRSRLSKLRDT
jgi:hypothetical protein